MNDAYLTHIRDLIQEDPCNRGLRTDPRANLINACPNDFAAACHSLAAAERPALAVVTGFLIPTAQPPCGETDGPLGALFLARALVPLGIRVALLTDFFCKQALQAGLEACGLEKSVLLQTLPPAAHPWEVFLKVDWKAFTDMGFRPTHLLAVDASGRAIRRNRSQHNPARKATSWSFAQSASEHYDRCHTMPAWTSRRR